MYSLVKIVYTCSPCSENPKFFPTRAPTQTLDEGMSEADGVRPVVQIRILRNVADLVRTADLQQLTHRGVREWLRTHLGLEAGTHYSKVWPASHMHALSLRPGLTNRVHRALAQAWLKSEVDSLLSERRAPEQGAAASARTAARRVRQVEVDAADEGEGIGLVSEVVFYEVINGVDVGRDGRFFGQDEGPMFFVLRALSDPLFEEGDLGGREGLVGLGGRHDFIRVVGGDAGDDFVPILVVGDVETEVGFAHGLAVFTLAVIGAVAFEAVGGEDGADVFREGEFFRIFGSKDAPDAADESCKEERWDF